MRFPSRTATPDPVRAKRKFKRRLAAGAVGSALAVGLFATQAYAQDAPPDAETLAKTITTRPSPPTCCGSSSSAPSW